MQNSCIEAGRAERPNHSGHSGGAEEAAQLLMISCYQVSPTHSGEFHKQKSLAYGSGSWSDIPVWCNTSREAQNTGNGEAFLQSAA